MPGMELWTNPEITYRSITLHHLSKKLKRPNIQAEAWNNGFLFCRLFTYRLLLVIPDLPLVWSGRFNFFDKRRWAMHPSMNALTFSTESYSAFHMFRIFLSTYPRNVSKLRRLRDFSQRPRLYNFFLDQVDSIAPYHKIWVFQFDCLSCEWKHHRKG